MISGMAGADSPATARKALGLLLLCFAAVTASAASPQLEQVMTALAGRQHDHVAYSEQQHLAVLEQPLESSGELFYDAPDRFEKRTLKPISESLVLEHGVVTVRRGRRKTQLDLREYPQILPFVESIRATLAGDAKALERVFTVNFSGTFDDWQLTLVPLDAKAAATVSQVLLNGHRDDVLVIEMRAADGDRSIMTIGERLVP